MIVTNDEAEAAEAAEAAEKAVDLTLIYCMEQPKPAWILARSQFYMVLFLV